jgi:hypothetical protein
VALLAMAEALSKAPRHPKRSVIFVWHLGEEMGLWGSQYFAAFSTVPIDKIVSQPNIDMIGRSKADGDTNPRNKDLSGPNEVYVIGSKMMSTELGNLNEAVTHLHSPHHALRPTVLDVEGPLVTRGLFEEMRCAHIAGGRLSRQDVGTASETPRPDTRPRLPSLPSKPSSSDSAADSEVDPRGCRVGVTKTCFIRRDEPREDVRGRPNSASVLRLAITVAYSCHATRSQRSLST